MSRPIDRRRWRRSIAGHLADMPRQLAALENSVAVFPDADAFRAAFESGDPTEYNRAQAVEQAFTRVQGFLARLADDGTKLAGLDRRAAVGSEPRAAPHFEALRDAGVIDDAMTRRLVASQRDRNLVEHGYVDVDAQRVYTAVERLLEVAVPFARRYRDWVAPLLR